MEILKYATEWAKAEIVSSIIFILFGITFIAATIGFWQMGKTDVAKAFIFPTLVAGSLLFLAGIGFLFNNKSRLARFETDYNANPSEFVESEIARAEKTMHEYKTIAFKVIPVVIIFSALLVIFVDKPIWRAMSITIIAFMVVVLMLDSNAHSRMEVYKKHLELVI